MNDIEEMLGLDWEKDMPILEEMQTKFEMQTFDSGKLYKKVNNYNHEVFMAIRKGISL